MDIVVFNRLSAPPNGQHSWRHCGLGLEFVVRGAQFAA
jgi:hypothetical protein